MRVLLTGASGFIGSYFCINYSDKYNIEKFSFLKDDFTKLDLSNIDVVVHLSALVHQMGGADFDKYYQVNVVQSLNLAQKAKQSGVKQFVFMSSIKACGEESDEVYTEKSICNPLDDYGITKLEAENELLKLDSEDFKVSIIRTPIVYGKDVKANIKNLVSLVNKVPILPFGNINNKRSMVYVGNLAHLIDEIIIQKANGIFLASDDEAISTSLLIEYIANSLNKKIYLIKIPFFETLLKILKPSFHKRLYGSLIVDNSQTKQRLNIKNIYSSKDGIDIMINKR